MIEIRSACSYKEIFKIRQIIEKEIWDRYTRRYFEMRVKHPLFQLEHARLIEVDGDIVSFCMFIPERMNIGLSVVNIGQLGFGFTRKKYRGKGFFTTLFSSLLKYFSERGYPLVELYGAVKLYFKFGFVPCFYHSLISLPVVDMGNKQGNCLVRRFSQRHIEPVFQFSQINNQNGICYPVRSKETWEAIRRYHPSKDGLYALENKVNHQVMGYMWMKSARNNILWVEEIETMDRESSESLLAICAKIAKRKRIEKICFPIKASSNFGQYCQELEAEVNLTAGKPEGDRFGWEDIMKVLDLYELLKQMEPELERRCLNSKYKDWTGSITIKLDSDAVNLEIEKGRININRDDKNQNNLFKITNNLFTQLVVGFKDINEISKESQILILPFQIDLISTLFPKLYPQTIAKDFFRRQSFFRNFLNKLSRFKQS